MAHYKGNNCHEGEARTCSECNPVAWKKERQADWVHELEERAVYIAKDEERRTQ